ncbi:MAG: hypothetical protein EAZ49_01780 [Oscillatoriales cyanobacterium]|nr:MAG: hypothetical protein EAZ49_01780 [Oscillatoriales cyanobacterium]
MLFASCFCQKELVESRNPCREKLKSDYSLLESSDFQVDVALIPSTALGGQAVNCQLSNDFGFWILDFRLGIEDF